MLKITKIILIFISSLNLLHASQQDFLNERPHPVSLLTYPHRIVPTGCKVQDFEKPCAQTDQPCKTRKEKCGDEASNILDHRIISRNPSIKSVQIINSKYTAVHGLDRHERITTVDNQQFEIVTENKADRSKLNRQTNQGSQAWALSSVVRAEQAGNLPERDKRTFEDNQKQGNIIRVLNTTRYQPSSVNRAELITTQSTIFSQLKERRKPEMVAFCKTVLPGIQQTSDQFLPYQTSSQRKNLRDLGKECQKSPQTYIPNRQKIDSLPSLKKPTKSLSQISVSSKYSRDNLHSFLNYLFLVYTNSEITKVFGGYSNSTIIKLRTNINHASTMEYEDNWKNLKRGFPNEYQKWSQLRRGSKNSH